jgi:hypothetical protein
MARGKPKRAHVGLCQGFLDGSTAADFVKATQRIYCTPKMASHVVLPVVK